MPKPNPLTQGLDQQQPSLARSKTSTAPAAQPTAAPAKPAAAPSRAGLVLIGGHFAPEVQSALKVIAAEERTTMQALLAEAFNMVFAKRGKPQIADIHAK
jgi:hypothetical protein